MPKTSPPVARCRVTKCKTYFFYVVNTQDHPIHSTAKPDYQQKWCLELLTRVKSRLLKSKCLELVFTMNLTTNYLKIYKTC